MTDDDIPTDAQMLALRDRWEKLRVYGNLARDFSDEEQAHITWALRAAQQCIPFRKSGHTIPGPPSALEKQDAPAPQGPPDKCPHCGANLVGDEIPENRRHMFGGSTHYSRVMAIDDRDRTTHYECPDCGR